MSGTACHSSPLGEWVRNGWMCGFKGEHRFMKLIKYKKKRKIAMSFYFTGFFFILKSLHGGKSKKSADIYYGQVLDNRLHTNKKIKKKMHLR